MANLGIRKSQQVVVIIYKNREGIGEVVIDAVQDDVLETSVFAADDNSLLVMGEVLHAAREAVRFHLHKPRLRELVAKRIEEFADHDDREAGEAHSPIEVDDQPF